LGGRDDAVSGRMSSKSPYLLSRVIATENRKRAAEELTNRWTQLCANDILPSPYVLIGTIEE
jgi:hypothetical protein